MAIMSSKLVLSLLIFSLIAVLALATQDPELKQCKHQCQEQRQFDERQKQQCVQGCEEYHREKMRREKEREEGGSEDIFNTETPVERLRECVSQCDQRREKEQKRECQQRCQEQYRGEREREKEREGEGWGDEMYESREREEEWGKEEREERNPYVFEDQHFTQQIKSEHGRFRVLQKFSERSKLLKGIENYRVAILEADPQTFLLPNHLDSEVLFFVAKGRGTITLVWKDKRRSYNIKRGDILRIPAGTTAYGINRDNNEKLVIVKLLQPVSTPGQFEAFFGAGGENPESFYKAFSPEILETALNTRRERLQKLFGQQKQGMIVKASEEQIRALSQQGEEEEHGGGRWPFGGGESKEGPFNLLSKRPTHSNQYGKLYEVNVDECKELRELDISISFGNITKGGMELPYYNSKTTKISVVVGGEGYMEMACPHLSSQSGGGSQQEREREHEHGGGGSQRRHESGPSYQKVSARLRRGMVFVVPAGHPFLAVASNNQNLEIICFEINAKNNEKYPLAGKRNIVNQFEREAKELAFKAPAREVDEVFRSQDEEWFVKGPRQQHQGRDFI